MIKLGNSDLDINLLIEKANEIRKATKDMQQYTAVNLETFLKDTKLIDATKYKFLIAIEGCISICNHIASRIGKKVPESYSDCFNIIAEAGVISKKMAENLMKMVKFRNLLMHRYWVIDDRKVYQYSKDNLNDIEKFLDTTGKYLKEQKKYE